MNNKIKILHLEDNPADADFAKEILLQGGLEVDITLAENRYEFEMMINSGKEFDLVLSDFTLPAFNGFAALKLVKEKMPEVPFILLSGEVCEEQAVEAMKLGATDYVFKHRMVRLGPAVKRALDECEKRKEYKRAQEKAEEEIIKAKEKAEEMNKLKTAFLSNMSHELRTPLIAIMGYAKLIYEKLIDDDLKEMTDIIYNSGDRLRESLDNILDLSTIESGEIKVNKSGIDVEKIMKEVTKKFAEAAYLKGLSIKVNVKEKIIVKTDEHIFTKVLSNLVSNAVKYTDKGNITITIDKAQSGGKNAALIKVIDTGIGIPEENYKKIFEPFRQGSEGLNRNYEGLGLGLTITKKFVDMMEGELYLESSLNKGSVFSLKIPVNDETFNTEKNKMKTINRNDTSENKKEYNVLIVEDDQTTRDLLKLFVNENYYATEVSSGEDAVDFAKEKKFDAVLMDISLSGINGLDATKLIRQIPGYANTPIIAVTAFAMRGDKERFLQEGCSHYLSKPFTKKTIIELLQKSINESLNKQSIPEIIYN